MQKRLAYPLEQHGTVLPHRLQIEFIGLVQHVADTEGCEVTRDMILSCFDEHYLQPGKPYTLTPPRLTQEGASTCVSAQLVFEGGRLPVHGEGNGPLAALVAAFNACGLAFDIADYHEHAIHEGAQADAMAYVEIRIDNQRLFGVGRDSSMLQASLQALVSAVCRATRQGLLAHVRDGAVMV